MLNWASTPQPDRSDWHQRFEGREWQYDAAGVYVRAQNASPLRTPGAPLTCQAIVDLYGSDIFEASVACKVPPELIVMTIATEVGTYRASNFTGPSTFRWEPGIHDYSAGPMQILGSTARDILQRSKLPKDLKGTEIPRYTVAPTAPPSLHPMYDARLSIWLGTAYIAANVVAFGTGFDPILVAACYNRGRLLRSETNPWHLTVTGDHLDRAAMRYGDACAVLNSLRAGRPGGAAATAKEDDSHLELYSLTREQADEEQDFYLDSGADVIRLDQTGGLVTLIIDYPLAPPAPVPPAPALAMAPPASNSFVLCIDRQVTETRAGRSFARTVGRYQAFFDRQPLAMLAGFAIERQGPGDNSKQGTARHQRIAAGNYTLYTHAGSFNKYKTYDYDKSGGIARRPWPAIRVDGTDRRAGILIHPAQGYLMSIGCINLAGSHLDAGTNIDFEDSRNRVIALIDGMKRSLGTDFPSANNAAIHRAQLEIRGEP